MIFEDWELDIIKSCVEDNVFGFGIRMKIEQLQETSKNKRYTLRTTDWLSEASKKANRTKVKSSEGGLI